MPVKPLPLQPLVGNAWVPQWAIRPGSYAAVKPLAGCMPLWLLLHSRMESFRPCFASREQLGATLAVNRSTITRHLRALERAKLVFVVDRDESRRYNRPPARWALDPFEADRWRPKVEKVLGAIAEEDGHDGRWYHRAVTALDAFERRSRALRNLIAEDMPFNPKPRKPRKKKRPRSSAQNPSAQKSPGGDGLCQGRASEKKSESPDRAPDVVEAVQRGRVSTHHGTQRTTEKQLAAQVVQNAPTNIAEWISANPDGYSALLTEFKGRVGTQDWPDPAKAAKALDFAMRKQIQHIIRNGGTP